MKRKFSMFLNIAMLALCVCAIAFGVYSAKTANLNVAGNIGFKAHNCDVDITASIYGHANGDDPLGTPVLKEDAEPLNGGNTLEIRATSTNTVGALDFGDRYFSDMGASGEVEPITIVLTITNTSSFDVLLDDQTATNASYTSVCSNPLHVLYIDSEPEKTTTLTYTLRPAKVDEEYQNISSPVNVSLSMNFSKIDTDIIGNEADGWVLDGTTLTAVPEATQDMLIIPKRIKSADGTTVTEITDITYDADNCVENIDGYKKVVLPRGITSVGTSLFESCYNLVGVAIPSSVTSFKYNAFAYCTSLTSITISENVNSISSTAFTDCSGLNKIIVEAENQTYDSRDNCNAIIETDTNTLVVGFKVTVIPNSVEIIGDYAFGNCHSLTSITIPNSVNSIGGNAFDNCFSLIEVCNLSTSLTITAGSTDNGRVAEYAKAVITNPADSKLTTINDYVVYNESETSKILVKYLGTNTSLELPSTVTSIHKYAFFNNTNLTTVTIPEGVTSIGDNAFNSCFRLSSITIPSGVNSIGRSAFEGCTGLTSITISSSVTKIGEHAFACCSSLTSITIPSSVNSIGVWAFSYCSSLTEMTILRTTPPSLGTYAISDATTKIYIPAGTLSAYKSADKWSSYADKFVELA